MFTVRTLMLFFALVLLGAAPPPVTFTDYATAFDTVETRTSGMPSEARVAAFRATFNELAPGLYADANQGRLDRRIAQALSDFPQIRDGYRLTVARFPADLAAATKHFRATFPAFVSPLKIYLAHELGTRDGGSDYIGGRKVMLFGADVIARIHDDNSIQPFLEHELFHLEHARHFVDCDQLWCPLWQEGLATYAASVMTPGADDHQLLLDQPTPIRSATDARWRDALCWFANRFDSDSPSDSAAAFTGGSVQQGFPSRFGYYVGLRISIEAARTKRFPALAALHNAGARPVVARALSALIMEARAPCVPPRPTGKITRNSARSA